MRLQPNTYGRALLISTVLGGWAATSVLMAEHPYNEITLLGDFLTAVGGSLLVVLITIGAKRPDWRLDLQGQQVRRVGAYVGLEFAILVGAPLITLPASGFSSFVGRGVDVLIIAAPLVLLASGFWRWPGPVERTGWWRLMLALGVAAAAVVVRGSLGDAYSSASVTDNALAFFRSLAKAISEELVYRVMLLSYLCAVLRSPAAALALTSIVFGLAHAPGEIAAWDVPPHRWLQHAAVSALTLGAAVDGLLYGTLWLRTRSFVAVVACHVLTNLFAGELLVPHE